MLALAARTAAESAGGVHRMKTACGKKGYAKREAETKRNELGHRRQFLGRRRGKAKRYRIYECPDCGQWHLTSKA